jgi:hypothetical protein
MWIGRDLTQTGGTISFCPSSPPVALQAMNGRERLPERKSVAVRTKGTVPETKK